MTQADNQQTSRGATWLPRVRELVLVASLMVPLSLLVVGCKLHKLARVAESFAIKDAAAVTGINIAFLIGWCSAWTFALRITRGRVNAVILALFRVTAVALFVVAICDHLYFLGTGMLLDAGVIEHAIRHTGDVKAVVLNELSLPLIALLLVPLLLIVLGRDAWLHRLAQRVAGSAERRRVRRVMSALAAGLIASVTLSATAVERHVEFLASDPFVVFFRGVADAISANKEQWADVDPAAPLVITASERTQRHNVVIITLESARRSAFGAYNPERTVTPFFDQLAQRGALVDNAYAVIPHTSKALVAIHCGVYPKIVTAIDEATQSIPNRCLADLLREQGYATAAFQPSEEGFEDNDLLFRRFGFDTFEGKESLPDEGFENCNYFGYEDDIMIGPALAWIDRQQGPFVLTLSTLVGHHDYDVPNDFPTADYVDDPMHNRYLNARAYIDAFLGKIYRGFEERGLIDNTVFVFIGDHGEGFGEHRRLQHDDVIYEEGLRVPMLLTGPGIAPQRIDGLRQQQDLLPTVLGLLGYHFRGGALSGDDLFKSEGHEQLLFSCFHRNRCAALRVGNFKYIDHFDRRGVELFDLSRDPDERHNLAHIGSPHPVPLDVAVERIRAWRSHVNGLHEATTEAQLAEQPAPSN